MTKTAFHPGEHLREELSELALSADTLAARLGVPAERLIDVLEEREGVTAELALRLGHFFGTSAQFWLNLQILYDLEVAEHLHGAEIESLPRLQAA